MALYGLRSLILHPERNQSPFPSDLASIDSKIQEAIEYRAQIIETIKYNNYNICIKKLQGTQLPYSTHLTGDNSQYETGHRLKSCLKTEGAARRAKRSVTFDPVVDVRIIPARPNATSRRRLPRRCLNKLRRLRLKVPSDDCPSKEAEEDHPCTSLPSENSIPYKVPVAAWSEDNNTNNTLTDPPNTNDRPPSPPPAWRDETFSYQPSITIPKEQVQSGVGLNKIDNNNNSKKMPGLDLDDSAATTAAVAAADTTIHPSQPRRHHFRFWLNHKSPQAPPADHSPAVPCTTSTLDPCPNSRSGLQGSECQVPSSGRHRRKLKMWLKLR